MKVLIAESDFFTQNKIREILEQGVPGIELIDTAQNLKEFKSKLGQPTPYSLIVSEVEFPDGSFFEAFRDRNINEPIIFMNASDQFAFRSFDFNCVDYIPKPILSDRMMKAFSKLRILQESHFNLIELVEKYFKNSGGKIYKKRFLTKVGNKVKFVAADEISYLYSEDGLSYLVEKGTHQKSMIDHGMNELETELLDPMKFFRINRSCIINSEDLIEMKPYLNSRLILSLKSKTHQELVVAREKVSDFKRWINQ